MSASWWEPLADDPPERAFFEQWLADCQTSAEGEGMVRDWEEVSPAGALGPYVSEDTKEWIRERRTLAVQLRIVRQGLGLTQGAAAKLLGVKVANYRANEQGGGISAPCAAGSSS